MFHVIEKEREWRQAQGLPQAIVAAGSARPLGEQQMMADYFRAFEIELTRKRSANSILDGSDGLGGIYETVKYPQSLEEDQGS